MEKFLTSNVYTRVDLGTRSQLHERELLTLGQSSLVDRFKRSLIPQRP